MTALMAAPEEDRRILVELIKARGRLQAKSGSGRADPGGAPRFARAAGRAARAALRRVFSGVEVVIMGKRLSVTADMEASRFRRDADSRKIIID